MYMIQIMGDILNLDNPSGREIVIFKELDEILEKILSDSLL